MKYEYKYLAPIQILSQLRSMIGPFVYADPYMKRGSPNGYTVRSIYFDTPQYDFYHTKIDGVKDRKKLRIRGYNDNSNNSIVFLEIKQKNEKAIFKYRAPVRYRRLNDLLISGDLEQYIMSENGNENALKNSQRFFFHIHQKFLKQVILVVYEREAYFSKFNRSLRITFDKNLRSSLDPDIQKLFKEENIIYSTPDHFILEVKFSDYFPRWLSSVIGSLGLKLQSYSKYTQCIDSHIAHNGHIPSFSLQINPMTSI